MTGPKAPRYADPFLNALMHSHQVIARGELWFNDAKVEDLTFVSGTVSGDRGNSVRRTFQGQIDPRRAPTDLIDQLSPYGSQLKVFRGIRYPNGDRAEVQVFGGRIDVVDFGLSQVVVRASDRAQDLVDARFETPRRATRGYTVVNQIREIVTDAIPTAVVNDLTGATNTITTPATWDRERTEALDNLAQTIGAEWYAGANGQFYVAPLPSLSNNPAAVWIVDSGDEGVAIERLTHTERARVYNAVVVNGEPPDGRPPAYGVARDTDPNSLTRYGGPFGKVPRFFSSQFITTDAQAQATALAMLGDAISSTRSVTVTCVPNPKLNLGDVVAVHTGAGDYDGLYLVNTFNLPLGPEEAMTMGLNLAMELDEDGTTVIPAALRYAPVVVRQ